MFACICRAVTCDQVTAAIDDGAATLKAVAKATRACTSCGTCRERIVNMLAERKPPCAFEAMPTGMAATGMAPAGSPGSRFCRLQPGRSRRWKRWPRSPAALNR